MARDAIARQYDVDKNSVQLISEASDKKNYHPGTITFRARKGKSVDLEKLRESIAATRLSGGTNMSVDWLEVTAQGELTAKGDGLALKVSGTAHEFVLKEDAGAKGVLARLREALTGGTPAVSVTGRVEGWNGRFPVVLKALTPGASGGREQTVLL